MSNKGEESSRQHSGSCTVLLRDSKKASNALGEATNVLPASRHRRLSQGELEGRKCSAAKGKLDGKGLKEEKNGEDVTVTAARRYCLRSQCALLKLDPRNHHAVMVNGKSKLISKRSKFGIERTSAERVERNAFPGSDLNFSGKEKVLKPVLGDTNGECQEAVSCDADARRTADVLFYGWRRSSGEDGSFAGGDENPCPTSAKEYESANSNEEILEHCFSPQPQRSAELPESLTLPPCAVKLRFGVGGAASPVMFTAAEDIPDSCSTPKSQQFKIPQPNSVSVLYGFPKEEGYSSCLPSRSFSAESMDPCCTPRAREFKIPDVCLCPQAPRKRKSSYGYSSAVKLANNSSQRIRASPAFFLVPDFDAFFGPPCHVDHHGHEAHFPPAAIRG
jgi:hypothetical protein